MSLTDQEMIFHRAFRDREYVATRKIEMRPEVVIARVVNNRCSRIDDVTRLPNLCNNIAHVSAPHPTMSTAHYCNKRYQEKY
jgi:hypothetical protein